MVAFSRSSACEDADEEAARDAIRRARRLKIAVAVQRRRVAAAIAALLGGQGPQGKKRREESPFSWADHLARLTPKEFKQRYRLDWTAFNELLKLIRADLEPRDEKKGCDAKWGVLVPPEVKLAIALPGGCESPRFAAHLPCVHELPLQVHVHGTCTRAAMCMHDART